MRQNSGLGGTDPRDTEIHVAPIDDMDVDEIEDTSLDAPIGTVTSTTAAADSPADKEIEASRVEIEQTRAEISETIEAIKERLSPENLKEQAKEHVLDMKEHAKEQVREATVDKAKEVMHTVQETSQQVIHTATDSVRNAWDKTVDRANESGATDKVKQNALPLAVTGVGLGWLLMSMRGKEQHHQPANPYQSNTLPAPGPVTSTYGSLPRVEESRMSTNTPYEYHTPGTTYQGHTPGGTYQQPEMAHSTSGMPEHRYDAGRGVMHESSGHNASPGMDMDTLKQNALPLAAAGLSLGWLVLSMKGQNQSQPKSTYHQPHDRQHGVTDRVHDVVGGAQEKVGQVAGQVREHVSSLGGTVKDQVSNLGEHASNLGGTVKEGASHITETVSTQASHLTETVKDQASHLTETVKDQASHLTENVKDRAWYLSETVKEQASEISEKVKDQVGSLSDKTRQTTQRASEGFQETLDRTPLAVAAVVAGLGAAVGLMTPETQPEKKVMGNAGDQILDKTRQTTQELLSKAENVARNTFDKVKDTAMDSMQNVKDAAMDSMQDVKETAKETVQQEAQSEGLTS